ncbi:hypothetical protein EIN_082570 [Entamoeba invadens IP1]|uniref:hypothetical protein n=1 Tax=Entamoeba invadens IP1 TaxID=370355 RepID=UPI0002C3DB32|nr:hypothetical protein EIN_082570 [Entamoeba invadens IP1]ELP85175.1 hypothetical protein EIN_082570 [Entamoeba invadens IP1]|eukprot:XP_004184521.1 hypothetical protein EIN_082570 [Entamoeba invadens IP1]
MCSIFLNQTVIWSANPVMYCVCTVVSHQMFLSNYQNVETPFVSGSVLRQGKCSKEGRTKKHDILQIKTKEGYIWVKASLLGNGIIKMETVPRLNSTAEFREKLLNFKSRDMPKPSGSAYKKMKEVVTSDVLTNLFKTCSDPSNIVQARFDKIPLITQNVPTYICKTEEEVNRRIKRIIENAKEIYDCAAVVDLVIQFAVEYSQILVLWRLKNDLFGYEKEIKDHCEKIGRMLGLIHIINTQPLSQHLDLVVACWDVTQKMDDVIVDSGHIMKENRLFTWNEKNKKKFNEATKASNPY